MLKKKRIISFMLILSMICNLWVMPVEAQAASVGVDGVTWNYTVSNGQATKVYPSGMLSGDVIVPDTLGGYPVTSLYTDSYLSDMGGIVSNGAAPCTRWGGATSIKLPDTVTELPDYIFAGGAGVTVDNLETVIANGVVAVGEYAFNNRKALTTVFLGNNCIVYDYAFHGCTNLKNIDFTKIIKYGYSCFRNCTNLEEVYISEKTQEIKAKAFAHTDLKRVEIHGPAKIMAQEYYRLNNSIYQYRLNESVPIFTMDNNSADTTVVIGEEVEYVGASTFGPTYSPNSEDKRYKVFVVGNTYFSGSKYYYDSDSNTSIYMNSFGGGTWDSSTRYSNADIYSYNVSPTSKAMTPNPYADKLNSSYTIPNFMMYRPEELVQVKVSSLQDYLDAGGTIPSIVPDDMVKLNSITATYTGNVVEGMELNAENVLITAKYNNYSTKTVSGSDSGVTFNSKVVSNVGANSITVSYGGLSTTMSVTGIAKTATGITATLNENYLNSNSIAGWNGTKKAFEVGTTLTSEMFSVLEHYDNGATSTLASNSFKINPSTVSSLEGNLITIQKNGSDFVTKVSVTGYNASLDGVMDDLDIADGDYKGLADKVTEIKNELIAKTEDLDAYIKAMKEIKDSIGMDGSSVTTEELDTITANVTQKMEELEELESGLKEIEIILAEILEQEVDADATATIDGIKQQIDELHTRLEEAELKAEILTEFTNEIKAQLGLSEDATEEDVIEKIVEIQTDLEQAKAELELYEQTITDINEALEKEESKNEELEKQLAETLEKVKEKVEELESLEKELDNLEEALNSGNLENMPQDGHLAGIFEKIEEINKELEETKGKADDLTQFAGNLRDKLGLSEDATEEDILAEIDKLLKQLEDTETTSKEEVESLRGAISLMGQQNTDLRNENALLKNQIASLLVENEQLKAKINSSTSSSGGGATSVDRLDYVGNMQNVSVSNTGDEEVVEVDVWYTSTGVIKSNDNSYVLSQDREAWGSKIDFSGQLSKDKVVTLKNNDTSGKNNGSSTYNFYLKNKGTGKIVHYIIGDIVLDKDAPIVGMTSSNKKITAYQGKNTYNVFTNKEVKLKLDVDYGESGKDSIYYMIAEKGTAQSENKWKKLSGKSLTVGNEVAARVVFKVTDKAGNVTKIKSKGFVIDTKAPVVSVANGKTYTESLKVQYSDESGIKTAMLNGKNIKSGTTVNTDGEYTLTVTDKAGNSEKSAFIIKKPVEVKPVAVVTTPVKDVPETVEKPAEEPKKEEVKEEVVELVEKPVETKKTVVIKANVPEGFESDITLCYIGGGETLTETLTKAGNYQLKKEMEADSYSLFYANLGEVENGIYELEAPEKFEVSESGEDIVFTVTEAVAKDIEKSIAEQENLEVETVTGQTDNELANGLVIGGVVLLIIIVGVIVFFVMKKKKWNY